MEQLRHDHSFGQDQVRPGERRTLIVIAITAIMMVVEIAAGWLFGSMALLADGLHMGSHAVALSINAFAYFYARKHAHDRRFSFGTGKVNALGGFAGAVLLAVFALAMAGESFDRLVNPVAIAFNQAILVAIIGLVVNGASMFILDAGHGGHHDHASHHSHLGHDHEHDHEHDHDREHEHGAVHDHNLRSAYLHVLADALTSVLAIGALLAAKFLGWHFMDPVMGIVGAVLVARWSFGLISSSSGVLLDEQAPDRVIERLRLAVEDGHETQVTDLHVWSIGPGIYAVELAVAAPMGTSPNNIRDRIPADLGIVHSTIEVHAG